MQFLNKIQNLIIVGMIVFTLGFSSGFFVNAQFVQAAKVAALRAEITALREAQKEAEETEDRLTIIADDALAVVATIREEAKRDVEAIRVAAGNACTDVPIPADILQPLL